MMGNLIIDHCVSGNWAPAWQQELIPQPTLWDWPFSL